MNEQPQNAQTIEQDRDAIRVRWRAIASKHAFAYNPEYMNEGTVSALCYFVASYIAAPSETGIPLTERRFTPEELLVAAERTLLPVDQTKRDALHDLTWALKQPDVLPAPVAPGSGVRAIAEQRKKK